MVSKKYVGKSVYLQNKEAELIYLLLTREKTTELAWEYDNQMDNILMKIRWFKHTEEEILPEE